MDPHTAPDLEASFDAFRSRGDGAALARVFDAAAPELLAVARYLVRRESEAEDLVQATFLTAIERRQSFEAGRNVLPWMLGILAVLAHKSRTARRDGTDLAETEPVDPAAGPDGTARENELRAAIQRSIAALPDVYARVLSLHLAEDLPAREIAERLAIEPGTVRVQIHRGLKLLRESLPVGFAGMAIATGQGHGLGAVRAKVLQAGANILPPAGTAATTSGSPLVVATAAAALILAIGTTALFVWGSGDDAGDPNTLAQDAHAPLELDAGSQEGRGLQATPASPVEARSVPVAEPARHSDAARVGPPTRFQGRLLRPDGSPAAGARVQLNGWIGNADRERVYGSPGSWVDPEPVLAEADGDFSIRIVPPRALMFGLDAALDGCAPLQWYWTEQLEGDAIDVGVVRFDPACALTVRIVDAAGAPRPDDYEVTASQARGPDAPHRSALRRKCTFDASTRLHGSQELPPGRVKVEVRPAVGDWLPETIVEVAPGKITHVDVVDNSAPVGTRITVLARTKPFFHFEPGAAHVLLRRDGREPLQARALERTPRTFVFDGLEPGAYAIEIDDPQFERWTQGGVRTGQCVTADLEGSAALSVRVEEASTHLPTDDYRLRLECPDAYFVPNTFDLHSPRDPVQDGTFHARVVPGTWNLIVESEGHATQRLSLGTLSPGEVREIGIALSNGSAIWGRAVGADGSARAGVRIELTAGREPGIGTAEVGHFRDGKRVPSVSAFTQSAADGSFSFSLLAPGPHTVRACFAPWISTWRSVDASEGETAEVELSEPAGGFVEGTVLLPEGRTTAELEADVDANPRSAETSRFRSERSPTRVETTSDGGRFRIGPLPVGTYRAVVRLRIMTSENTSQAVPVADEVDFEIQAGRTARCVIDARATMRASVHVRVLVDGVPATSGCIRAFGTEETWLKDFGVRADGRAEVSALPGATRLQLQDDCDDRKAHWAWVHPDVLALRPGQSADLELRVDLLEREVHFVMSADRRVLFDRDIEVVTGLEGAEVHWKARTNARGSGRFRLPIGPVVFRDELSGAERRVEWGSAAADPLEVLLAHGD